MGTHRRKIHTSVRASLLSSTGPTPRHIGGQLHGQTFASFQLDQTLAVVCFRCIVWDAIELCTVGARMMAFILWKGKQQSSFELDLNSLPSLRVYHANLLIFFPPL